MKKALDYVSDYQLKSACKDAICIAPSKVTQMSFAVLEDRYHHIVLTHSFKLVSFFYIYIYFIWSGVCHFLFMINSNLGPISHRFRYRTSFALKSFYFFYLSLFNPNSKNVSVIKSIRKNEKKSVKTRKRLMKAYLLYYTVLISHLL